MMLTEAEHAHFNDLKFMSEVNFKCSSYDITSDIISCFHDHEDLKKTFSEFTHVINAENSAFLLTDHHSDSVIEFSSFSMHDNYADISVIASASCSCCQYKNVEFIDLTDDFDDMMKLDESLFIAATGDCSSHDFNVKK